VPVPDFSGGVVNGKRTGSSNLGGKKMYEKSVGSVR
jgi:hypothetical protein